MSQALLFPYEIQQMDKLIGAVLQDPALLPRLLAHDVDLYHAYGIDEGTCQRLRGIQAVSLKDYCQQLHGH